MHSLFLNLLLSCFLCPSDTFVINKFPERLDLGGYFDVTLQLILPYSVQLACAGQKVMLIGNSEFVDMEYYRAQRDSVLNNPNYISDQVNDNDHCKFTVNKVLGWDVKKRCWKVIWRKNNKNNL